jgi:glycosyltransferase involved in cell wall biosynthesis
MNPSESNPLVSVIIPTYNNAALIEETINSVRAQTYQNLEIIVVDDGSTDKTAEVVTKLVKTDARVHYEKIENSFSPTARNIGFSLAQGEYVAVIDSDDLWPANKIEIQLEALKESPDAIVIGCVQRFVEDSAEGKQYGAISCPPSQQGNYIHNLLSMHNSQMVNLNTLFTKKSIICADGLWDPSIRTAHDWEVWIRLARKYRFIHINEVLQHYRKHSTSVTRMANWEAPLKYQLIVADRHSPPGIKNTWKRFYYRRLRYQWCISTLIYEDRSGPASTLWLNSLTRSNMIFSLSGLKLFSEIVIKTYFRLSSSTKNK